jgi:branched-chain amino acid transport system ATP-binding protein
VITVSAEAVAFEAEQPDADLEVTDVTLRFKGLVALNGVSLSVPKGKITGIMGPNGAGKSSLLNCVSGFYRPAGGQILWRGRSLIGMRPHEVAKLGIGRTFQGMELVRDLSVLDNVLVGRHMLFRGSVARCAVRTRLARKEEYKHRARAEEILSFFDMSRFSNMPAGALAYGEQKLVAIARALAMEPQLLLLDEPTSGMNRADKREVGAVISELNRTTGLTEVVIEHDIGFIRDLCDHVIVLDFGEVIAAGSAHEVLRDQRVIEAYVGRGRTLVTTEGRLSGDGDSVQCP